MAEINVTIDTDIDVDIEVEDFLNNCNEFEIDECVFWLRDNGHINSIEIPDESENRSYTDQSYLDTINKLNSTLSRLRLSEDDIYTIIQIANKL